MRAALSAEDGAFDLVSVADPRPGPGDLLVEVSACGLCGSDLKARGAFSPGTIMGHEFGGRVVGLGPGTEGWREGLHVAVLPVASCGACTWCQAGDVAHCGAAQLIGLGGRPGGFAELVAVPAASSFLVPDGIDPVHAALVEPYAVGLHCVDVGGIGPGDHVLVIGAGTVGLTTIDWARLRGAGRLTVVDPVAARRDKAGAFGATDALADPSEATPGAYDVVVECVGKPGLLDACIAAARTKGRIVGAGTCAEADPFWSIAALMKEVTIRYAVYYTPAEFRAVVDAFVAGRVDPAVVVGREMPLSELNRAFDELAASTANGKILVEPS